MLNLLRPHQWLKNGFVLLGLLFGHGWSNLELMAAVGVGFVAFCMASSAVYVLNDYHDREADARHPRKKTRPIASRRVSLRTARMLLAILAAGAALLPAGLGLWAVTTAVVAYLALNTAYTLKLKHVVLVDVFCIVAGFMIRLVCGTYAVGITPSRWMLFCSFMLALFLGFAKRRAEFGPAWSEGIALQESTRLVLRYYTPQLLDVLIAITVSMTILTYGLYTLDPATAAMHGTENLIITLPVVTFGVFRYLYLIYRHGAGEDTGRELLSDPQIRLAVTAWAFAAFLLVR
ncbi:decaprenyl-phosphate phosphoribosyltransferase [Achromobacter xylosoxidans]|uniref:decaprenyl-phosphate phosphoribosyltransferase n=1 Tax=Alcaligenes xylosoxydans xylosoxydans TaxID=85698 RepID=UPI001C528338|nr:decaprenyl-phosphate phosphoribosyltransferase [Achromobacter xylosoxidans]